MPASNSNSSGWASLVLAKAERDRRERPWRQMFHGNGSREQKEQPDVAVYDASIPPNNSAQIPPPVSLMSQNRFATPLAEHELSERFFCRGRQSVQADEDEGLCCYFKTSV